MTTQIKKLISASVLLLIAVLIAGCAASGESAATLPVTATSISPSPTQLPTESPVTESITEWDYVAFGDSRTRGTTWPDIWIKSIEADLGVKVNFNN